MGVYFIAAGSSTRNRAKTLDRPHDVAELVRLMPPEQARRLEREFPEGSGVYVWGASERHRAVLGLPAGTYVVDVSNAVVRQVFELVFAYRTPDTRIQHFLVV